MCKILRFLQIEDLWQPCIKQVISEPFFQAFAHFVTLCQILAILTILQTFSLSYLLLRSVISDYNSPKAQMIISIF